MDHWSYRAEGGRNRNLVENPVRQYRQDDWLQLDSRRTSQKWTCDLMKRGGEGRGIKECPSIILKASLSMDFWGT